MRLPDAACTIIESKKCSFEVNLLSKLSFMKNIVSSFTSARGCVIVFRKLRLVFAGKQIKTTLVLSLLNTNPIYLFFEMSETKEDVTNALSSIDLNSET